MKVLVISNKEKLVKTLRDILWKNRYEVVTDECSLNLSSVLTQTGHIFAVIIDFDMATCPFSRRFQIISNVINLDLPIILLTELSSKDVTQILKDKLNFLAGSALEENNIQYMTYPIDEKEVCDRLTAFYP